MIQEKRNNCKVDSTYKFKNSWILLLFIIVSCNQRSDKDHLLEIYSKSDSLTRIENDSNENTITRYDDKDIPIDKHWFNEKGSLHLYTFYNRFYDTSKASFIVNFNNKKEITKVKGEPFYISSNLFEKDTLETDTVKAYMYLANSPFLKPKVEIVTKYIQLDENYLAEKIKPDHIIYFEDYPKTLSQKTEYCFYYKVNNEKIQYIDSMIYKSVINKKK